MIFSDTLLGPERQRSDKTLEEIAKFCNPRIRGWINYDEKYYRSALYVVLERLNVCAHKLGEKNSQEFKKELQEGTQVVEGGGVRFLPSTRYVNNRVVYLTLPSLCLS